MMDASVGDGNLWNRCMSARSRWQNSLTKADASNNTLCLYLVPIFLFVSSQPRYACFLSLADKGSCFINQQTWRVGLYEAGALRVNLLWSSMMDGAYFRH